MPAQGAVADIEWLVIDKQPQKFAVGDVDQRLSLLRIAVGSLGVGHRQELKETVQVGAGHHVRLPFIQVATQPDVSVREGKERLRLPEEVQAQCPLGQRPWVG